MFSAVVSWHRRFSIKTRHECPSAQELLMLCTKLLSAIVCGVVIKYLCYINKGIA